MQQYQHNMQQFQQMQQNALNKRQSPPNRHDIEANGPLATAKMNLLIASQQKQMQQQHHQQQQQQSQGSHSVNSDSHTSTTNSAPSTMPKPVRDRFFCIFGKGFLLTTMIFQATVTSGASMTTHHPPSTITAQISDPEIPVNVINKSLYLNNNTSSSRNPTLGTNELNLGSGMSVTARDSTKSGKANKNQSSLLKNFTQKSLHLPNSTSVLPLPPGPAMPPLSSSSGTNLHHPPPHYTQFPPTPNALMQLSAMSGGPPNPYQTMPPNTSQGSAMDALIKSQQQQAAQSNWMSGMWHDNSALGGAGSSGNSGNGGASGNSANSGGSILMDNNAATLLSKIPKSLTVIPQQKSRPQRTSSNEDRHHQ
jgi:hypothetical protein